MQVGQRIIVKNARFYVSVNAKNYIDTISGKYYIYNDTEENGKYRITDRRKKAGIFPAIDNAIGYINSKDIYRIGGKYDSNRLSRYW